MHSVLVYHTISSPSHPLEGDIDISPEKFDRQLRWLAKWHRVVSLEETASASSRARGVAITFDDGFRDNLTVALPLLEKYQLPATLFVAAAFVGREGYLSEDELREIARHPLVTVGAHGLWHRHFTRLSANDAREELRESRSRLKRITGRKIDLMAWPYGDCNEAVERLSQECGYRAAWSVWEGSNSMYSRWRVPLGRRDNMARFIAKVSGAYMPAKILEQKLDRTRKGTRWAEAKAEAVNQHR
jgi:peptidoglycan/xylan/chitin deacetylase (PgdA/CDA1 family)